MTSADCPSGSVCVDRVCASRPAVDRDFGAGDGGGRDAGSPDFGPPVMCSTTADCDDSSMCTTEECVGGSCMISAVACDDGDACTDDTCDPASGCTSSPSSCDDSNACTVDSCDSATGCAHTPVTVAGGTCTQPIDISAGGTFTGDSSCAGSDFSGTCGGTAAPDVAFVLDLPSQSMVTLDARASDFGLVLFVGSSCGSESSGCNSSGTAMLNVTLPAGRHYVGLDGRAMTDSGAWTLNVSATPVVTDETVTFPDAGDVRVISSGTSLWNAGDYIQGTRATSLSSIRSVQLALDVDANALTCDTQDMRMRINGTIVGNFSISSGTTSVTPTFNFSAIGGPNYTIRVETTRTVNGGCGSAGLPNGSTVTLRN